MYLRVSTVRWNQEREICFKQAMAKNAQFLKHRAAQNGRILQRSTIYVLNHVGTTRLYEHFPNRLYEARPFMGIAIAFGEVGICLARRRCMNSVEPCNKPVIERQNIGLDERQRIVRLRIYVDADDIKSGFAIANARTTSATEEIKEARSAGPDCVVRQGDDPTHR